MKSWRGQCEATIAIFVTSSALLVGCSPKGDAGASNAPGSQPGAAAGAKAPTPEQEAAKARAIQQGPAIEAAMAAGPHPKP